ncbi:hypothetical protein SDC49_03895 [Lactobacillus sp. R2/2]|nr:hypothetical protein [Lactobacillus sp. R2/2]
MWYFSENHAFLFHIARYFAGYLYPSEQFTVSGHEGKEQYELGKSKLKTGLMSFSSMAWLNGIR